MLVVELVIVVQLVVELWSGVIGIGSELGIIARRPAIRAPAAVPSPPQPLAPSSR